MSAERARPEPPRGATLGRTLRSFSYAGAGLVYLARTQPNFRVHLMAIVAVLTVALLVRAPAVELAILVLAIGLVMAIEAMNTAIEAVVDLASPDRHPLARIAKDTAAAAVLIAAIVAAMTGLLLLGPRMLALLLG